MARADSIVHTLGMMWSQLQESDSCARESESNRRIWGGDVPTHSVLLSLVGGRRPAKRGGFTSARPRNDRDGDYDRDGDPPYADSRAGRD